MVLVKRNTMLIFSPITLENKSVKMLVFLEENLAVNSHSQLFPIA